MWALTTAALYITLEISIRGMERISYVYLGALVYLSLGRLIIRKMVVVTLKRIFDSLNVCDCIDAFILYLNV